ncbi:hypothetical protein SAMN05660235_02736 [Sporolituus thermophilus DSM 23256]|uniref:Uncharacterized protein n=1 Tax=Sporolituus thermophilus DSM 23256 TaxID=1123285 RepID=A0A1G7NW86_9FIRM|nr:hypothetical protein SAMN05660235_02736 [Sporolituus thermophilus DSM 23256]
MPQIFLQWFINEQVEEEASAGEIFEKLKNDPRKRAELCFTLTKSLVKENSPN